MSSKVQKYNKYSPEFREKILKEYFDGNGGWKCLGKKHGISYRTIRNWVYKVKASIDVNKDGRGKKSSGRPKTKNLTLEDYKERYEILKKYQAFLQARREKK